jgi:hypothetical protein
MNMPDIFRFGGGGFALALSLTLLASTSVAETPRDRRTPRPAKSKAPAAAKPAAAPTSARPAAATNSPAPPKPPQVVTIHTDFALQAGDDVMLRTAGPPLKYSDKGLIQNYTRAELKNLKGDHPELPGFPSETARLKNGQLVLVFFGKKTPTSSYGDKGAAATTKAQEAGDGKTPKTGDGKSPETTKPEKGFLSPPAGVLAGVLSRYDEPTKKFVLRVDTQHEAGKVPTINTKEMLKDFEVTLIVILKD